MDIATNILVATDFSELGQAAVEDALAVAKQLGATLNVVSVYTLHEQPEFAAETRERLAQAEQQTRARLAALEGELRTSGRLGQVVAVYGDPAAMILRTAEELRADLIVLGTRGRSGLARLALGSTAESVLRQAAVPVLIVKRAKGVRAARSVVPAP